eukprot:3021034-Rhodomonas_salina.3
MTAPARQPLCPTSAGTCRTLPTRSSRAPRPTAAARGASTACAPTERERTARSSPRMISSPARPSPAPSSTAAARAASRTLCAASLGTRAPSSSFRPTFPAIVTT